MSGAIGDNWANSGADTIKCRDDRCPCQATDRREPNVRPAYDVIRLRAENREI